ncbi:MAG: hypothetical protein NVS1B14_06720 [Vulcanimicrobiaceae bacterium]
MIERREQSASEVLLELVHGGLRLRHGYMRIHRKQVEKLIFAGEGSAQKAYLQALVDTFGQAYVEHLCRWLEADGILLVDEKTASFM